MNEVENDVLAYLALQPEPRMLTKSELLEYVRERGASISDRNLTYYTTEGLIPKSIRIGSRSGAYPESVGDLLVWIVRMRRQKLPVEAIRELVPIWQFLRGAFLKEALEISEFEYLIRQHVRSPEGKFAVPLIVPYAMPCVHCFGKVKVTMKNRDVVSADTSEFMLRFVFAELNTETGKGDVIASSVLLSPTAGAHLEEPNTIIVGVPVGIDVVEPNVDPECLDEDEVEKVSGHQHTAGDEVETSAGG